MDVESDPNTAMKVQPGPLCPVACSACCLCSCSALCSPALSSVLASSNTALNVQAIVHIKLRADFADGKAAAGVEMVVPLPKDVQRVACDPDPAHAKPAGNQTWDWQEKAGRLVWRFKKLPGGADATLKARFQSSHRRRLQGQILSRAPRHPSCP